MSIKELVIQSQLVPPRQRKGLLRRPCLEARLAAVLDYPLTIVQAGAGYGKSTALAALAGVVDRLAWYTITEPDRDPLLFVAHLVCAFERQKSAWCDLTLLTLEQSTGRVTPDVLTPLINALTLELDDEAVLVLDDYHLVADVAEIVALVERLVDYIPPRLHVIISSRQSPSIEALNRWRVKGQVLTLTRSDLAFTAQEIETLFREQYGYPLSSQQAQILERETEGWAIALQMVGASLQRTPVPTLDEILGQLPATLEALFDYLAYDVLARQPPEVQRFLLTTSVLREMDGAICDHLLAVEGSAATLRRFQEAGLFVVSLGDDVYRYHRLFHDFLRAQLSRDSDQKQVLHRRASAHFRQAGHPEETVYHLLEAGDHSEAAGLIEEIGPTLVRQGRFDSLSAWIVRLPAEVQIAHPGLDLLLGDVLRLRVQFEEALEHYGAAERLYTEQGDRFGRSRALRGQAQVYLDTVRPLIADKLLEEALHLLEPHEHRQEAASLLDQLAENKLNLGYPDEARSLHHEARLLRTEADPDDVYLEARALVRTGRLSEAQRLLGERAKEERLAGGSRPQRFHRETLLLLSLVHSLQGEAEAADRYAREGIAIGHRLDSPFVEAVGNMRLGHAVQLGRIRPWEEQGNREAGEQGPRGAAMQQAVAYYHQAIDQVLAFKVLRTQVEPLWGLCRAFGFGGDLPEAERYATQALEIAQRAGDEWICNLIQVTMGASYALAGKWEQARGRLIDAAEGFARVGDSLGRATVWLWLAWGAWQHGDVEEAMDTVSDLLPLAREGGYDWLLTHRTFAGLKDDQAAIPLLLEARKRGIEVEYAGRLLAAMGITELEYHPGCTLAVRTLGPFAVWCGDQLVTARDWKREKARQVFQLLLTYRGQWFYREQIADLLWPHLPAEAAEQNFKVAFNALNRALEPGRPAGTQPFFAVRQQNAYGLNPAARIVVDADDFESLAASDDIDQLRQALALYEDDYLPDSLYEDWSSAERQRLRQLYLATADRLARHLLRAKAWNDVIHVCQAILARDSCNEGAYCLLMHAHAAQDNRSQVHNVYQRCIATLREELGVEPSPTTRALFEKLG